MIILQKDSNGIIVGRSMGFPIAVFMFNSWNRILDTVLVSDTATVDESELLRNIAYQFVDNISKGPTYGMEARHKVYDIFQECFNEYTTKANKKVADKYHFNKACCRFIKNIYDSPQKAVDEIIAKVKEVSGLSVSLSMSDEGKVIDRTIYTVSVDNTVGAEFTFWNANNWPDKDRSHDGLHIVPGYHPSSPSQGRKICGMLINGSTDALISSNPILAVYSPKEARKENGFGSTWNYVKHPYKVAGKSFQFVLSGYYHASKEFVDDAVKLILCTLGAHPTGNYIGISGGFYYTYDASENLATWTAKRPPHNTNRGSENHCMWTYAVLQKENEVKKAYIPKWFIKENWIDAFENQKHLI